MGAPWGDPAALTSIHILFSALGVLGTAAPVKWGSLPFSIATTGFLPYPRCPSAPSFWGKQWIWKELSQVTRTYGSKTRREQKVHKAETQDTTSSKEQWLTGTGRKWSWAIHKPFPSSFYSGLTRKQGWLGPQEKAGVKEENEPKEQELGRAHRGCHSPGSLCIQVFLSLSLWLFHVRSTWGIKALRCGGPQWMLALTWTSLTKLITMKIVLGNCLPASKWFSQLHHDDQCWRRPKWPTKDRWSSSSCSSHKK